MYMYLYHKYLSWIVLSNAIDGNATDAISALITCCKYFGNRNRVCSFYIQYQYQLFVRYWSFG